VVRPYPIIGPEGEKLADLYSTNQPCVGPAVWSYSHDSNKIGRSFHLPGRETAYQARHRETLIGYTDQIKLLITKECPTASSLVTSGNRWAICPQEFLGSIL